MTEPQGLNGQTFSFITDVALREDLEDALLFVAYLIDLAQQVAEERYREEIHRVIVLCLAAVVEALCLFVLEHKQIPLEREEYKNILPVSLPGVSVAQGELILAVRKRKSSNIADVPFVQSIDLLSKHKIISPSLKRQLTTLRGHRNSQHLYGRGRNRISREDVASALRALELFQQNVAKKLG